MSDLLLIAVGAAMLASVFVGLFVIGARLIGWREMTVIYAGVVAVVAFIGAAVALIELGAS